MAKAEGADEDTAVQDFMQILEEHRRNCERQGKYVEAEIAKNRLEELKLHEESRRKEAMRSRQIAERLGVEEAHMLEFQQFNVVWDTKMAEFEQQSEELINSMKVSGARGASPLLLRPRRRALTPRRAGASRGGAQAVPANAAGEAAAAQVLAGVAQPPSHPGRPRAAEGVRGCPSPLPPLWRKGRLLTPRAVRAATRRRTR